ncbi:hypothetical protein KKB73_02375 [Patescibacteria group bacterium]|nr:hypothetical protein [Patescibacteria group bacterium]
MILNNIKQINKLDNNNVAESIQLFCNQIQQVLEDADSITIPREYKNITQIVINGMGGSNLGAGIVKSVFNDQIKAPISITPGYAVFNNINKNTLYFVVSYSGATEEPLSVFHAVKKQKAKIIGITSRNAKSKLMKIMLKDNIPGYIFNAKYNPSGKPHFGLGYSIFGIIAMLSKAGLLEIKLDKMQNIISFLKKQNKKLISEIKLDDNIAKKIAVKLYEKQPIVVGAEFLTGNLRVLRNQLCENSKNFASYLILPDLNHYAMEGLANPKSNKKNLIFFFLDSKLYHSRVQKRSALTKQVIKNSNIQVINHQLTGKTKLEQSLEALQLSSWIAFYLAMLNNANPANVPIIDWFKKKLR